MSNQYVTFQCAGCGKTSNDVHHDEGWYCNEMNEYYFLGTEFTMEKVQGKPPLYPTRKGGEETILCRDSPAMNDKQTCVESFLNSKGTTLEEYKVLKASYNKAVTKYSEEARKIFEERKKR
jgi:hypothetical protein